MDDERPMPSPSHERRAEQLKALAHPQRLAILEILAARGTCICGQLVSELPIAQATVSQHLKVLKEAGFIQGTVDGPRSCYCLDPEALAAFRDDLDRFLGRLKRAACCNPDLSREETMA
jgi:DNA-binding transcriptional ArsR family regulator